jgi:UDP-2,3-diacylglucosamine pyrophosphatase LpxH
VPDLPKTQRLHDIIVVSDLHLGRGKNPRTGRYHRLEAFFYDDDFHHFCTDLVRESRERGNRLKLVLNGDTFDLLRIEPEPDQAGGHWPRYNRALTPTEAALTIRHILEGHPMFVRGVAEILAAGHTVVFLPGNHDPEMQWDAVRDEVRGALMDQLARGAGIGSGGTEAAARASEGLRFESWFHCEPGRIWIEHGCQYDPENAFRYPLRRYLAELDDDIHRKEVDLPLGTFFQRYLYNSFGSITFIVPNSRSNFRYFRWLLLNRPRLLARVATVHAPFLLQILRRLAKIPPSEEALRQRHEAELGELVATSPVGERLHLIDGLKQVHGSAALLARQILVRIVKATGYILLAAFFAAALWFLGFQAISTMQAGFGFKAVLFLTLNFLFLVTAVGAASYFLLRPSSVAEDPRMRRAAAKIAGLARVPIVTFGHSHEEVIAHLEVEGGSPAWYFNTGTWIAVFTADSLLPRERVQYTFLRVRGHVGELLHWSPGRREAAPVVLLEEDHQHPGVQTDHPPDAHAN